MQYLYGHIAFAVRDMERTMEFYCGKLGFQPMFTMRKEDGTIGAQYVKIAHRQHLEFFPAEEVENTARQSYRHLSLYVKDIRAAREELLAKGVEFYTDIMVGKSKCLQMWARDPDGNAIEFMQTPPDSLQAIHDPD
jgi:catechol 2,3-dioxygenase-like lactoylglutathione lyase family enzyme